MGSVSNKLFEVMNRLYIYPKDVMVITGRSDKFGRNLIKKIKLHLQKQEHQVVSIEEFCKYMGLQSEAVTKQLR